MNMKDLNRCLQTKSNYWIEESDVSIKSMITLLPLRSLLENTLHAAWQIELLEIVNERSNV